MKEKDLEYAMNNLRKTIKKNYKPQPEWEDKHPILATIIILSAIVLNPVSLFIIFMSLFFLIVTWGIFF